MSELAFCCAALLKNRGRAHEVLALLPDSQRAAREAVLKQLIGLDDGELRNRWRAARDSEIARQLAEAAKREAVNAANVSPLVRHWLLSRGEP